MITFRHYLSENKEVYYHGTSPLAAADILKNGFKKNKSLHSGKIFLTKNFGEAQKYSKIANGGALGTVVKVNREHLDDNHIHSQDSGIIQYTGEIHPSKISKVN